MLQEALMDSEVFQAPHDTDPSWAIAKSFFRELVNVTRRKVRWPDMYTELDREEKDSFDGWRRDAGEVIVCASVCAAAPRTDQLIRAGIMFCGTKC